MRSFLLVSLLVITGCDSRAITRTDGGRPPTDSGIVIQIDSGQRDSGIVIDFDAGRRDSGGSSNPGPPGSGCTCDADCMGTPGNAGVCTGGVCMMRATGTCASPGSSGECPAGLRCWANGASMPICWPDCASFTCAGDCDAAGSCMPSAMTSCDPSCGSFCEAG